MEVGNIFLQISEGQHVGSFQEGLAVVFVFGMIATFKYHSLKRKYHRGELQTASQFTEAR